MKIVIDAGHGYFTSGKRVPDGSMREWEFNNAVALKVKDMLEDFDGVQIMFTHDTTGKTDVPLTTRTNMAKAWGADLFASIHANAFGSGGFNSVQGIETFVYDKSYTNSMRTANAIQEEMLDETGRPDRGVRAANFHVLRETSGKYPMAAILVECGFMTNHEEAALLKTDAYRTKCAVAIVNGIAKAYGLKGRVTAPTTEVAGVIVKPSTTGSTNIGTIEVLVPALNVRKGDSFTAPIAKVITKGEKYKVYGKSNGMYDVGGGLWVSAGSEYVKYVATAPASTSSSSHIGIVTIKAAALNVREGNSFSAPIAKVVHAGEKYKVYGKSNGMYNVGGGLWLSAGSEYVSYAPVSSHIGVVTIVAGSLNVRESADFSSRIVKVASKGEAYKVYAYKNGMYQVGKTAWVSANSKYVSYRSN